MSLSSCFGLGLSQGQLNIFKLCVSYACRKMTANQILELADHLHDLIRKRSAGAGSLNAAIYDRSADAAEQALQP